MEASGTAEPKVVGLVSSAVRSAPREIVGEALGITRST
jgi:hypothetical protein